MFPPLKELAPQPSRFDARLDRAEDRFLTGKRLYLSGDKEGARREFDRAVDLILASREASDDRRLNKRFEDLIEQIYRYDIEGLGPGVTAEVAYDKAPIDEIIELTFPIDPRLKNKLKEEVAATVSQLPLELNDSVLSFVNYFSSDRGRRTLIAGLRRAGRYKPMIQRILDEEGVPQELIFLAQAESGFLPRAVSRKKAVGMWQFVKARGNEYGLKQTAYTDDRLDPEKATRAAARHLRDLYLRHGDWYLALAAYNCGPGCVDRAVQRTGYADFWELRARNAIPRETTNYIPIIVAMTIMMKNAADYGIDDITVDPPLEYETLEIEAGTNLDLVAVAADRPATEVREMNPSLLKNVAPTGFQLRVPKGSAATVAAALELVPAARRAAWRLHRAQDGDTLASIARQYRTQVAALASANGPSLVEPEPGDLVVVPTAVRSAAKSSSGRRSGSRSTVSRTAARKGSPAAAKSVARSKPRG
jgi:membrane-bound lytic murein transglycosylase D